jgi:hypothetical protein
LVIEGAAKMACRREVKRYSCLFRGLRECNTEASPKKALFPFGRLLSGPVGDGGPYRTPVPLPGESRTVPRTRKKQDHRLGKGTFPLTLPQANAKNIDFQIPIQNVAYIREVQFGSSQVGHQEDQAEQEENRKKQARPLNPADFHKTRARGGCGKRHSPGERIP